LSQNNIKAANKDARFHAEEILKLKELTFSLAVLTLPEIIRDIFNTISINTNRTIYG
jgi:AMMECR1 domain-containing protein